MPKRVANAATRLALSNVFALALALAAFGPVLASNFGSGIADPCDETVLSQCIADNWTHTVYLANLGGGATMYPPSATAVAHINGVRDVSVVTTISSSRDVTVFEGSYGDTNWVAFTACGDGATYGGTDPDRWCRPQVVGYNMTEPNQWWLDTQWRIGIACQELAHTLGLRHKSSGSSCMVNIPDDPDDTQLDSHDKNELNTQYLPY